MKQSEMSTAIDRENPDCVMQIYTGKVGKLSDIPKFTSSWYRLWQSERTGPVSLESKGWALRQKNLRQRVWVLKRQIMTTWHRMVSLLTFGGKSTKGSRTASTPGTQKIQEGRYSTSKGTTVPSQTNT